MLQLSIVTFSTYFTFVYYFFLNLIKVYLLQNILEEALHMRLILMLGVIISFLAAIFKAGYDDKPGASDK